MKLNIIGAVLVFTFLTISTGLNAMPGPAGGSPPAGSPPAGTPPTASPAGTPPCWAPPCVPIDGGIGILLAAGAFVGARKLYKGTR